jgi:hypothetical protein
MIFHFEHIAKESERPWVIIESPSWFDARMLAMRIFDCQQYELASKELKPNSPVQPDVSLRWKGTDAGDNGGSPKCRRLEFFKMGGFFWSPIEEWSWP